MSTKSQKRKQQKKAARRKKLTKERNQRVNQARFRYRLDVKVDGDWKTAKRFRSHVEVNKHIEETEAIRKRGDTEIIEGRVVDMNSTFGAVVKTIKSYSPQVTSMLDAAKTDVREAAEKINAKISEKGVGNS